MLFLRLWNYIRGYVIIVVEGSFLEKFINICTRRQLYLWDLKIHKNGVMTLKVSIKGFKLLRPAARKSRCRVRILKKQGLPFIINRYRRRKTFAAGAVLFVLILSFMTSFVWTIEIDGNEKIEDTALIRELAAIGVKPGVLKYTVDPEKVVNEMMLRMDELSWISVVVKGTKVKISVAERKQPPDLIPVDEPCDIVAERDGIIKNIVVKEGQEKVKVGDTVTKGQILVSGAVDIKNQERKRLVHSIAVVEARTWYEHEVPVETSVVEDIRTGRSKDLYYVDIFNRRIKLLPGTPGFKDYETVEIEKRLSLGERFPLPFAIIIYRHFEKEPVVRELSPEDARNAAAERAYGEIIEIIPEDAEIVNVVTDIVQTNDRGTVAKVIVECIEDIGTAKRIGG